jgi:agmatinase
VLGAGLDLTESCRAGTRAAPDRIRAASDTIETYSPILDRDLEDLDLADWGDVSLAGLAMSEALDRIEERFAEVLASGFGLLLGGEHTVALAGFRAARRAHPGAALVQLDAPLDARLEFEGARICHATWANCAGEQFGWDSIVQLGIRSGTRDEFRRTRRDCLYSGLDLRLPDAARQRLGARPVYLSVDVDVLDPGAAPGTGCPEPGGVSFRELLECLYALGDLNVVGADVCEVLPDTDPAGITATAAAKIVRELLLLHTPSAGAQDRPTTGGPPA